MVTRKQLAAVLLALISMLALAPSADAYFCDCDFCKMYPNSECFDSVNQSVWYCYMYVFEPTNQCYSEQSMNSSSEDGFLAQLGRSAEVPPSR